MDINLEKIPGPLLYEILKFLPLDHFQLLEMMSQAIKLKLEKNLGILAHFFRNEYKISCDFGYDYYK